MKLTKKEQFELFKSIGYKYDSETGNIYNTKGEICRHLTAYGYIQCTTSFEGNLYRQYAHRLAWFLYYNELPPEFIDHIDRNRINNKIANLRPTTKRENCSNIDKTNTSSKYVGVLYDRTYKGNNKWSARMLIHKKRIFIGRYSTEEEAYIAYQNKLMEIKNQEKNPYTGNFENL